MRRRKLLAGIGTAAVAVPGCSALGGCGPGEDAIGDLASTVESETPTPETESTAQEYRIKGSVQEASKEEVVVSDGTGIAALQTIGGFYMKNINGGECVWATGFPTEAEDRDDVDVLFLATDVGLEK